MALAVTSQVLLLWELEAAGSLCIPSGILRDTCPCTGTLVAGTDGVRKRNCANIPRLCSSLNRCPISMLLRSWNSQLILLIHIPNRLIELVLQFNLKHKVNWTTIKIKWPFHFYGEGDYIFCKSTHNWNQPDEFFIWLFISFQFTLYFSFNMEGLNSRGTVTRGWRTVSSVVRTRLTLEGVVLSTRMLYCRQIKHGGFIFILFNESIAFIGFGFFFCLLTSDNKHSLWLWSPSFHSGWAGN